MDEKKEPLLCPFCKETTYHPGCKSEYRDTFASPSSTEKFLPCIKEKCQAWIGGGFETCALPNWKMPEV
jgi:hypothetical protein